MKATPFLTIAVPSAAVALPLACVASAAAPSTAAIRVRVTNGLCMGVSDGSRRACGRANRVEVGVEVIGISAMRRDRLNVCVERLHRMRDAFQPERADHLS